jgi:DNA-directed RNA polymerase subunit RPC12/RpoP
MVCLQCKADRVHRSHRAGLKEWAASQLGYYPYRCQECGERRLLRQSVTEAAGTLGKEIVRTRRRIEWVRTRREMLLYGVSLLAFAILLYFITRQRIGRGDGG